MANEAIDLSTAVRYFQDAEDVCKRDNGALWGVQLRGPLLFVDPKSRQAVANQPDAEGRLTESGELYAGEFPDELNVANGVADWGGVKWTTLTWPLPEDSFERRSLMAHELWHRIQDSIGFPASNPSNDHLDTVEGRYWLQLEWRALREALLLGASGPAYGLLLDASGADWRKNLKPTDDLGLLLARAHSTAAPRGNARHAGKRAKAYDDDSLLAAETGRQQNRQKQTAEYRARLVDGPVLILPNHRMSVQFDPRNLFPLGEHGTVYPAVRVTDVWGVLVSSCGALVSRDWKDVRVPAPTAPGARPLSGDGWTLELNEGWQLVPARRVGDYTARMAAEEHKDT